MSYFHYHVALCACRSPHHTRMTHKYFQRPLRHEAHLRFTYCIAYGSAVRVSGAACSCMYPELRTPIRNTNEYTVDGCIDAGQGARAATAVYSCMEFASPSTHNQHVPRKKLQNAAKRSKTLQKRRKSLRNEVKKFITRILA